MTEPEPASGTPATGRTVGPAPRWMRVLLVISLALNLLVAGLVVGAGVGGAGPGRAPLPRDPGSALLMRAMPDNHRRAFETAYRRELRETWRGGGRGAMRADMDAALAALRTEDFDQGALAAAVSAQRTRMSSRVEAGDRVFLRTVSAMSPAERRAYADRIEETIARWARRAD
jgi:uncharacterized membrane protein